MTQQQSPKCPCSKFQKKGKISLNHKLKINDSSTNCFSKLNPFIHRIMLVDCREEAVLEQNHILSLFSIFNFNYNFKCNGIFQLVVSSLATRCPCLQWRFPEKDHEGEPNRTREYGRSQHRIRDEKEFKWLKKITLARQLAISKVPTVSIFEAMIGMPRYVCFELRNLISRYKST